MMEIRETDGLWIATDMGSEARIWLDGSYNYRIHVSDPCGAVADPAYGFAVEALSEPGDVILVWDECADAVRVPRSVVAAAVERLRATQPSEPGAPER